MRAGGCLVVVAQWQRVPAVHFPLLALMTSTYLLFVKMVAMVMVAMVMVAINWLPTSMSSPNLAVNI